MNRMTIIIGILAIGGLCQFGSQRSVVGKEKPAINFYGTLRDQNDNSYSIENITISGMYSQIPVYVKPLKKNKPGSKNTNPDINKRLIDLNEIDSIKVLYEGDTLKLYTYNDREYIEIEITFAGQNKITKDYLIERTRKLFADETNEAGPIEMQLSFEAIDILTISGCRQPEKRKSTENNR